MFPLPSTLCIQCVNVNIKCHLYATLHLQTREDIHTEGSMQKAVEFFREIPQYTYREMHKKCKWYINMTRILTSRYNGTTKPYRLNYHKNTKFLHVGKTMATKYSAVHVDSRETNNIIV